MTRNRKNKNDAVFAYKKTRDTRNDRSRGGGGGGRDRDRDRDRYNDNGRGPRDNRGRRGFQQSNRSQNQNYNNRNRSNFNDHHYNQDGYNQDDFNQDGFNNQDEEFGNNFEEQNYNNQGGNGAGFMTPTKRTVFEQNTTKQIPSLLDTMRTPNRNTFEPIMPQPSPTISKEVPVEIKPIVGTQASSLRIESKNNSTSEAPAHTEPEKTTESEAMIDVKKIKKEKPDKVSTPQPKPVVVKKPPPSSDSSSSSSSDSSSSSEEEIPPMPKPLKGSKTTKDKSKSEDDVVCLGKRKDVENLIDDNDTECLVCKSDSHPSVNCTKKCIKCSHSSYSMQIVCNTCGETYPPKANATATVAPNPFLMFMQFMQFCMGQYMDYNKEMSQPIPAPVPVLGNTQESEVTRQDIVDHAKRHSKKSKSETKSRKKRKSERSTSSESDSDSSSKATASTKKRRKMKNAQTAIPSAQPGPQMMPNAPGFPYASGFNPMMAFSQMMGMSPAAMAFQQHKN